ncbi:MAG: response regulator [Myxococcota bacterium]
MNEPIPRSILVVDDDERFSEVVVRALGKRNLDVRYAPDTQRALELAEEESPELALVDLRMPGEWGLNVVRELLNIDSSTKIVVLTAYGSIATAVEAVRLGAVGFLQKPASVDEILLAFERPDLERGEVPSPPEEVPSLARAEWEHINRVLTECGGSIRKASKLLGLHRRTLQRKLAKFPVEH